MAREFDFNNATILGGKLQTSGAGAVIETQNGTTDLLSGCTIAAASLLEVTSNATLKLSGGTIGVGAVVETLTGGRRGRRHRPQFRHPVREWLQQRGPDHQRRRGHGRRCRGR